jgi:hypothetical protein
MSWERTISHGVARLPTLNFAVSRERLNLGGAGGARLDMLRYRDTHG